MEIDKIDMIISDNNGRACNNPFDSESKNILLIEPPFYNFFGYKRWYYPMTLALVGTYFEEKGHSVKIYDADKPLPNCKSLNRTAVRKNYPLYKQALKNNNHPIWEKIKKTIQEFSPDIIGLTSITAKMDSTNKIANIAKKLYGKKFPVVFGGPHAQGMRQISPDYNFGEDYDYIVTHIPNLINRKPNKKLIMDYEDYSKKDFSIIFTSTGCPNSCTFCCNSATKKITYRDISNIEQELDEMQKDFGKMESLIIEDDCFFSNPKKRFEQICKLAKKYATKVTANARVRDLSEEKIETFIENNGKRINIGIESGSQKILDEVKKRIKVEDIVKRTELLKKYDEISSFVLFIAGFPFETLEDLKLTEDLAYRVEPSFISLNRFTPYPGTQIWRDYYINSNLKFEDLFQLNPDSIVKLDDEMEGYIEKMFKDFDEYNKNKKLEF